MDKKFKPTVFNKGYMGEGKYRSREDNNGSKTKRYLTWFAMMQRCYSENSLKIKPTYEGCSVCGEWWNFQVFCKWFDENYYIVPEKVMCLDKDILSKDNKIYSPETCVFVPKEINKLLTLRHRFRGDLPLGVTNNHGKFAVHVNYKNKQMWVGNFNDEDSAFNAYKSKKEEVLKLTADEYKNFIPNNLYQALMLYKI